MSSDEQSDKECPLCMEPFDEVNFYPCTCQYQICTFCWHRLRTDDNGLCPACRQPYPEQPVNYQPPSSAEIQKLRNEKKQRQAQKNKLGTDVGGGARKVDRQHLSAFRVLQRNLVYVVGLSQRLADAELLRKSEYFGKFGKIVKVAVSTAQGNNNINTSYTAYVTYSKMNDALRAIQAINNLVVDGRLVKASLGTTKYCSNFLKGQQCHKVECMYLHEVAEDDLSFTKDDMHQGKHTEYERKLHEQLALRVQNQSATTISSATDTTESSTSSESTSPKHTTLISNLVNDKLIDECKNIRVLSDTEDLSVNGRDSSVSEINCNNTNVKLRNISESESSNISNEKSSVSVSEIAHDVLDIIDNHQNGSVLNRLDDKDLDAELNTPPPGFAKIVTEKPLLLESQIVQHELLSASNGYPLIDHINGWFDAGQLHMNSSPIDDLFHQPEPFDLQSSAFCMPPMVSSTNMPLATESSSGVVDSLFQNNYNDALNSEEDLKMKLISSDPKSVMTCDELERILLSNSVPPGFKRQNSMNSCTGATTKNSRQTPVSSGMNFFLDLYDDLGFDPFSESSKALADMLEEEKITSASR